LEGVRHLVVVGKIESLPGKKIEVVNSEEIGNE
jgi:hypothetical protein